MNKPDSQSHYSFAVVVGVNNPGDNSQFNTLQYSELDAREMAKVLREEYGFVVKELIGQNATVAHIRAALRQQEYPEDANTRKPMEDDLFLFYFSGHGTTIAESFPGSTGNRFALYPFAAGEDKYISIEEIRRLLLNEVPCRNCTCIFDACRTFVTPAPGQKGHSNNSPSLTKDISVLTSIPERVEKRVHTFWGCGFNQYSWESPTLGHGVMTKYLLDVLYDPGKMLRDFYSSYEAHHGVSFRQIFEATADLVAACEKKCHPQNPLYESSHTTTEQLYLIHPYQVEEEPEQATRAPISEPFPNHTPARVFQGSVSFDDVEPDTQYRYKQSFETNDLPELPFAMPAVPARIVEMERDLKIRQHHLQEVESGSAQPLPQLLNRQQDARQAWENAEKALSDNTPIIFRGNKKFRKSVEEQIENDPGIVAGYLDFGIPVNRAIKYEYVNYLKPCIEHRKAYEAADAAYRTTKCDLERKLGQEIQETQNELIRCQREDMVVVLSDGMGTYCRSVDDLNRLVPSAVTALQHRYPNWSSEEITGIIENLFYPGMYGAEKEQRIGRLYTEQHYKLCLQYQNRGVGEAHYDLAMCRLEGPDALRDADAAFSLMTLAAEQGHMDAIYWTGAYYARESCRRNPQKAYEYLIKYIVHCCVHLLKTVQEKRQFSQACRIMKTFYECRYQSPDGGDLVTYDDAVGYLTKAYQLAGDASAGMELYELYQLNGQHREASSILGELIHSQDKSIRRKARKRLPVFVRIRLVYGKNAL